MVYKCILKSDGTLKNPLEALKDTDIITQKSGVVCKCKCYRVDCDEEYFGKSTKTSAERFKNT